MLKFIRNWFDRRTIARADIAREDWDAAFDALPLLDGLSVDEERRLKELVILFCHRKTFDGAHGLVVTQPMALVIALQACLLVLELGLDSYDGWSTIIVYQSGFVSRQVIVDEYGIEHHIESDLSGEAWEDGPLLLAWDDTALGGYDDGHNLVIHEFAHKLDMLNGSVNGFPPLHPGMDSGAWTRAFSDGFEDFRRKCDDGIELGIDDYAATSPGELFAVLSEVFFEQPDVLHHHYPAIYDQMRLFYRQDPLARLY